MTTIASSSAIDKLLAEGKSIWITNKTRSLLLIEFKDALGISQTCRVPIEEKPINLSDYYPPSMIRENATLRRLISQRHILLMDPDKMEGKVSAGMAGTLAEMRSDKKGKTTAADQTVEALVPEEDLIDASPKVAFLCEQVKTKEMKAKELIDQLDGEPLTKEDLTYVINEMKGDDKIIGWATNKLASVKEEESGEDDGEGEVAESTEEALTPVERAKKQAAEAFKLRKT